MKLWLKQTLLSLLIILLSVSACLYFFVALQTNSLLVATRENGEKNINAFLEHLSALDSTSADAYDMDDTTRTALIQYTFSTYAHLFQNAENTYALAQNGKYLYNVMAVDPKALLPIAEDTVSVSRMTMVNGKPWLLYATVYTVLYTQVVVYYVQDITATYAAIDSLTRAAQLALLGCLALSVIILPPVLRRTLYPMRKLTRVSEQIAGGQYGLRSHIQTGDEVGELSRSFDRMAETVEQKILTLEDTAKRRELLLGALTHEMKTPMTAIIGFSDSLLSMPLNEEKRMEAAHEIHEAAVRTERLSQKMMRLISLADCPLLVKRVLSTDALFAQTQQVIAPQLSAKDLTLVVQQRLPTVTGDGDLLTALLTNLIDNAVKACDHGKTITLSAYVRGGKACLQVADQGSGIPKEKIALVTEPFYRVDKARSRSLGGAGLGLTLCRMIAQAHGGMLEIESELKQGTTVRLCLPMDAREESGNET